MRDEYKRLSDEVAKSLTTRFTIVGLGLAAVGALFGFAVRDFQPGKETLPAVMLSIMVPGICFLTLFLWASEVRRARRASWYLWGLERRINHEMNRRLLRWEEDIRMPANPLLAIFHGHYYVILAFFTTMGAGAAAYGTYALKLNWLCVVFYAVLVLALIVGPLIPYLWGLRDFDHPDGTWPPARLP